LSTTTPTDERRMDRSRPLFRRPLRLGGAVVALAALGVAAGCGSSTTSGSATTSRPAPSANKPKSTTTTRAGSTTTSSGTTTSAGSATSASGATPVYQVRTGTVPGLGTVLVDGQGLTLYLFVPDKQSGHSTCAGTCAQAWPPLLLPSGVSSPTAGPGVNASLLGTTKRSDGTVQVTYNRWPLYLWVNDSQPGQATGQALNNLGGLWYVLSPAGKEITTRP
jgi:predicted lipoprotein with Yx(FWY)xxD motif